MSQHTSTSAHPATPAHLQPTLEHPVVLLGSSGYFGSTFAHHLTARSWPWTAFPRHYTTSITDLHLTLRAVQPSFLINAAGMTGVPNVDACQASAQAEARTYEANVLLPGRLAQVCADLHIPWGHVSSGCIYQGDGPKNQGWRESDPPTFAGSYYSFSKDAGERAIQQYTEEQGVYLWRVRVPFDAHAHPKNYLTKLQTYPSLVDVRNSLSHRQDAVWAMLECWARRVPWGIYHVTNPGSVSTREVVGWIQQAGIQPRGWEPQWFDSVEAFQRTVVAPRSSCVLNTEKLQGVRIEMPPVREAVQRALKEWKVGVPK